MTKYRLTDETKTDSYRLLYRIEALKDFGNVKKGDLGGFIETEANLSHEGDCWIYDNACVSDGACVSGDAKVSGDAMILEVAQISGSAAIFGYAIISGSSWISGNEVISGDSIVYNDVGI